MRLENCEELIEGKIQKMKYVVDMSIKKMIEIAT